MEATASTTWSFQHRRPRLDVQTLVRAMQSLVGEEYVSARDADRLAYARDRWPWMTQLLRFRQFPQVQPDVVVWPGSTRDVSAILAWADAHRVPVVPFGAGSGVCGGVVPLAGGVALDLKRMQAVDINSVAGTVTCQPGMLGIELEEKLNRAGWTLGHFPQSMRCSTVGGWVATRSAGQASTLYGKIEDMVVALEVVLPGGKVVRTRPRPRAAAGPDLMHLFIGSEGTLGVITEVTLRLFRKPEEQLPLVLSFPSWRHGLAAIREALQSGLKPAVVRLYDEAEAARFGSRRDGTARATLILFFEGRRALVQVESSLFQEMAVAHGGQREDDHPAWEWLSERFLAKSPAWVQKGYVLDTFEVAAAWDRLEEVYQGMKAAVAAAAPGVRVSAHWSHVYPDGACMYATFVMPAPDVEAVDQLYQRVWDTAARACLHAGATLSHHHGVGLLKAPWLAQDLGAAHEVLLSLKRALDPKNIMNPGKLGLPL